jgi:hypothetical protein
MVLFAAGYSQKDVAAVIGCDGKTLRKVFPVECREQARAALVIRTGMMTTLLAEAEKGNVAACKELDRLIGMEQARVTTVKYAGPKPDVEDRKEKLGKKEQAQLAAREQRGLYEPPPAPGSLPH